MQESYAQQAEAEMHETATAQDRAHLARKQLETDAPAVRAQELVRKQFIDPIGPPATGNQLYRLNTLGELRDAAAEADGGIVTKDSASLLLDKAKRAGRW